MRPDFPEVVDNSLLDSFRSCPRKTYLGSFEHWKPNVPSVHLHAGKAFAEGLEVARVAYFQDGMGVEKAMALGLRALLEAYGNFDCPTDSTKSAERMAQAFEFYLSGEWALDRDTASPVAMPDGRRAIEFSFAEPLPVSHPTTGQPLIYAGRADQIVGLNNGLFIEDDKTATQLGPQWANQWEMRAQFTGYTWAARQMGWKVDGCLIRAVAILKNDFKRAQHITYRPQWEVERWLDQTVRDLRRMIAAWEEGHWDFNMGEACLAYGGCGFMGVCKRANAQEWLPAFFTRRKWDPITRTEINLG